MNKLSMLFVFSSLLLLNACATQNSKTAAREAAVVKTAKVLEIEKKQKIQEESNQERKDRERILSKKTQMEQSSIQLKAHPQTKKIEMTSGQQQKPTSDRQLYGELVAAYDRNNEIAFFSRFQSFLQNYSSSPLADDAIYLAGLMTLSNKNYGPALRYFNQVLTQYPLSNKASAALYAKGVALKKLNLSEESRLVFLKVRKSYPGSPEAMRAQTELKLLKR